MDCTLQITNEIPGNAPPAMTPTTTNSPPIQPEIKAGRRERLGLKLVLMAPFTTSKCFTQEEARTGTIFWRLLSERIAGSAFPWPWLLCNSGWS